MNDICLLNIKRVDLKHVFENIGIFAFVALLLFSLVNSGVKNICMALLIIIFIFLPLEKDIFCLFLLVPISNNILFYGISFEILILMVLLSKLFLMKNLMKTKQLILVLIIISIQCFSLLYFKNTYINILKLSIYLLLFFSLKEYCKMKKGLFFEKCMTYLVIGIDLGCILSLYNYSQLTSTIRYSGIWLDENYCGMFCAIGIILSLIAVFYYNTFKKVLGLFSIFACLYMGVNTLSRTFMLVLIIVLLFLFYFSFKNKGLKPIVRLALGILILVFFYVSFNYFFSTIIEQRGIISENGYDWSNGRLKLWKETIGNFLSTPKAVLFGCGYNNTAEFNKIISNIFMTSHNTYIDFLVQFGIFGLTLLLYSIFQNFKFKHFKISSNSLQVFFLFLIVILYMFTLSMTQYIILYLSFSLFQSFVERGRVHA